MNWGPPQVLVSPQTDPYCDWAEATHWRGFRRLLGQRLGSGNEGIESVRVLVQAPDEDAARVAMGWTDLWVVSPLYGNSRIATRHFVAELPPDKLDELKRRTRDGIRWELSIPFRDAETVARAEDIGAYGPTRAATDFRPRERFNMTGKPLRSGSIHEPVLAVIDFGCPFLNTSYDDEHGKTRIAALWDQGAMWSPPRDNVQRPLPWPWADGTRHFGYGRTLRPQEMHAIRRQCREAGIDEGEAYRRIDYLINYDDARRRIWNATHGSHVTSVAAGWPDPLRPASEARDAAANAPIVFVQLPALTAADSGGGSLSAQVLDALRFVLDLAGNGQPVVVNLSYGSFAGPHDGSSLIEQAMDELVEKWDASLAIVVGAGNGRLAGCHVKRSVVVDRSALLRVQLDPGDFTDTFVETWFQPDEPLLTRLQARVRSADRVWSPWIRTGQYGELHKADSPRPVARLSFQHAVPNGQGSLLLLALAPTARPADDDGPLASQGEWQLEIRLDPDAADATAVIEPRVDFKAWIERDEAGWLGQGAQPRFAELRHGESVGTLNSLATGQHTIVAGGFRLSDGAPADYSATGPRNGAAFVYGACEESEDLPHILGAAVRNGDGLRMNGTSVAAPVVARRVFNHVAADSKREKWCDWSATLEQIVDDEFAAATATGSSVLLRHPSADD